MRWWIGLVLAVTIACGESDPSDRPPYQVASAAEIEATCADWCQPTGPCKPDFFTRDECMSSCRYDASRACGKAKLSDLECFMAQGCDPENYGPCLEVVDGGTRSGSGRCRAELVTWCEDCISGDFCGAYGVCGPDEEVLLDCVLDCKTPEDLRACVYERIEC